MYMDPETDYQICKLWIWKNDIGSIYKPMSPFDHIAMLFLDFSLRAKSF